MFSSNEPAADASDLESQSKALQWNKSVFREIALTPKLRKQC